MSLWPQILPNFTAGLNGYFIIPTGYRTQEYYYDNATDTTVALPSFSLEQTASEIYAGAAWSLGPTAEVNGFMGYFTTADNAQQAFRWGLGAVIEPFGPRAAAEFGYSRSLVRTGSFPTTEAFTAGLAIKAAWGFTLVPGMWADLSDDPLYGGSIGLRFSAPVARVTVNERGEVEPASDMPRMGGTVLVPPPLTSLDLADRGELWQSIQRGIEATFDNIITLPTLDVPGLPFDDKTNENLQRSVRAIAKAHPEADWLLIARMEREDVSRGSGIKIPFVMTQPNWTAECRLRVRLVNLRSEETRYQDIIEAQATRRMLTSLGGSEQEVLSFSASRELTFEAYREAGRMIARELSYAP